IPIPMAAAMMKLSLFVAVSGLFLAGFSSPAFPPTCNRIECPDYTVIDAGEGYEIRRINSSFWMSTSPIDDISFVAATRTGFLQLFRYIQGDNEEHLKIEMTGPVLTQVKPSDGPFCTSSFVVSFYVPKANQQNPPPAEGLHPERWGLTHLAVRQFGGFIADDDLGEEAAALYDGLEGTEWGEAVRNAAGSSEYTVAQYNSPFEFRNRVNEIWFPFYL
ncbi:hypothetical protein M569_00148, partial [Genlisea aurea]